jgi:hypothetical protein
MSALDFEHVATGVLFALAAGSLLLLGVGIHTAWATVPLLTARAIRRGDRSQRREPTALAGVPAGASQRRG